MIFCLIFFAVIPLAFGLTVETDVPSSADKSQEFEVNINVLTEGETQFDLLVILPNDWEITNWTTSIGQVFAEHRLTQYLGENVSAFRWKFEDIEQNVDITYTTKAITSGSQKITTLWTYPGGFESTEDTINILGLSISDPVVWLIVLFIATGIVISGIMYREYKKYGHKKIRTKRKTKRKKAKKRKKKR